MSRPTTAAKPPRSLAGHSLGPVFSVSWSVDGRRLASGAKDEIIRIWNPERADYAKASVELKGHSGRVNQLRWDPTHPERLASAGEDGTLRFWDIRQGTKPTRTVENAPKHSFLNLCWHPDATLIAIGDSKDRLQFFETSTGRKVGEHTENFQGTTGNEAQKDQINEVAFSHDGSFLFVPTGAGTVNAYDFAFAGDSVELRLFRSADPHACVLNCTDLDPRGRYLALGGADSIVSLLDLKGFYSSATIVHQESEVRSIGFSFDGELLAIAGKETYIIICSVATGAQLRKLGDSKIINSLAWHPAKYLLAWGSDDKLVKVANLAA